MPRTTVRPTHFGVNHWRDIEDNTQLLRGIMSTITGQDLQAPMVYEHINMKYYNRGNIPVKWIIGITHVNVELTNWLVHEVKYWWGIVRSHLFHRVNIQRQVFKFARARDRVIALEAPREETITRRVAQLPDIGSVMMSFIRPEWLEHTNLNDFKHNIIPSLYNKAHRQFTINVLDGLLVQQFMEHSVHCSSRVNEDPLAHPTKRRRINAGVHLHYNVVCDQDPAYQWLRCCKTHAQTRSNRLSPRAYTRNMTQQFRIKHIRKWHTTDPVKRKDTWWGYLEKWGYHQHSANKQMKHIIMSPNTLRYKQLVY